MAQSVKRRATGSTAEELGFYSWQRYEIVLLHSVRTGSEAKSVSSPVGTGGCFAGGKAARLLM
jgi:hypothetical protein